MMSKDISYFEWVTEGEDSGVVTFALKFDGKNTFSMGFSFTNPGEKHDRRSMMKESKRIIKHEPRRKDDPFWKRKLTRDYNPHRCMIFFNFDHNKIKEYDDIKDIDINRAIYHWSSLLYPVSYDGEEPRRSKLVPDWVYDLTGEYSIIKGND
jgi:hypothetical protein